MKKLITLLLFTAVTFVATAQTQMVRLTRFEGQNITGVNASSGFYVELYPSDKTYAVVEISANLEERLEFSIDSKGIVTVGIKSKNNFRISNKERGELRAKIYLKQLDQAKASSGASVKGMGAFESQSTVLAASSGSLITDIDLSAQYNVIVDCSSAGRINAVINAKDLRCELSSGSGANIKYNGESSVLNTSSAAKLDISGTANSTIAHASSGSGIDADDFNVKSAQLNGSSGAGIKIGNVEELNAKGSSGSGIRYKGTPKIISLENSSGSSIRKVD